MFDPAADLGREGGGEGRRQSQRHTRGGGDHGDGVRFAGFQPGFRGERGRKALSLPGEFAICSMGFILTWNQITDFI